MHDSEDWAPVRTRLHEVLVWVAFGGVLGIFWREILRLVRHWLLQAG
ncbi:hypothetical protein [Sphingomonas beigongshangi]|nr:hypothetical protein [Sphingomonas beigongshangi]